jgi:5-oxoprolinase (ATP-hydrolysing)
LLRGAKYPARNPLQNVNDLKAQIAANEKGVRELRKMIALFGMPVVKAYMGHVQDNAAESVRRVLDRLHDSEFSYEMDQGTIIKVRISVDKKKREATVDFTGTSPQQNTNFNAPAPVTRAAVLYVFRVMVDDEIPMNAGCSAPNQYRRAGEIHALAGIPGGGRRGQCRDFAGRDELPVRRAGRAVVLARHDEQPHLRQR